MLFKAGEYFYSILKRKKLRHRGLKNLLCQDHAMSLYQSGTVFGRLKIGVSKTGLYFPLISHPEVGSVELVWWCHEVLGTQAL